MDSPCWTHRSVIMIFSIAATSLLLFLTAVAGHARSSYCGPVSYNYTRHLQWQMEDTDKQGRNKKQVKEERMVLDGGLKHVFYKQTGKHHFQRSQQGSGRMTWYLNARRKP